VRYNSIFALFASVVTDFGYTGQKIDNSTGGLMYYGARYYLPGIQHFISADTIVPGAGSQALNRYSYVNNNPVNYTDSSGYEACDDSYGFCPLAVVVYGRPTDEPPSPLYARHGR